MTDYLLALIPEYGLYLIFVVVLIASIGLPFPSTIAVVTAGSLTASGDLIFWQVYCVTLGAFLLGDQFTFNLARLAGPSLLSTMKKKQKIASMVNKSENVIEKYGVAAIFLCRTVFSPVGPFTSYVSGALQMGWGLFTSIAALGATVWTTTYMLAGYVFAGQSLQLSSLVVSSLIVSISTVIAIICGVWALLAWRKFELELEE